MYLSECDKGQDNCYWSECSYDDYFKKFDGLLKNSKSSLQQMRDSGIESTYFTNKEEDWKCFKDIGACTCEQFDTNIKHCFFEEVKSNSGIV